MRGGRARGGERERRACRERFEREVSAILADPEFAGSVAKRIAAADLQAFLRELEQEFAALDYPVKGRDSLVRRDKLRRFCTSLPATQKILC